MSLAHSPRIVTDGLLLCLDAGNSKSYPGSGTTWTDLSGNENNGTLTNMDGANLDSANGGSFTFDGTDEEVIVDIGNSLVKDFTLEFWMKSDATVEGRGAVAYGGSTYAIIAAYRLKTNSCSFYFGTTGATSALNLTSVNLADNNWHQVVQTYDGTNARIYVDNNLEIDNSGTFSGNLRNTSNTEINVGRWTASGLFQDMSISSVKVYNKSLTASEIQQNYNALKSRFNLT